MEREREEMGGRGKGEGVGGRGKGEGGVGRKKMKFYCISATGVNTR